jgi:hypothetical protein
LKGLTGGLSLVLLFGLISINGFGQKVGGVQQRKCGSITHLESLLQRNPQLQAINQANQQRAIRLKEEFLSQPSGQREAQEASLNTLTGPVYIPVVVHIILPNALQVSDQDVQQQIDKLNTDFAGLNADSANIPAAFKSLFGKSNIQFRLARKSPSGSLTNGIERRNSSTQSNVNLATDPIKRTSLGGLDAWDFTKYFNVWVGMDGSGFGVLGYATFPGTDIPANEGVFINVQSFGNNSCYVIPEYGLGRSLVHETGHYFGLNHIWGDDSGACTGDDFAQLTGTCTLPAALLLGDTPNQGDATSGCLFGVRTDNCSTAAPGFMYQNYMDYTDDACYAMFTQKQVERMEYVLENCRASYLTSDAGTPPIGAVLLDVSPTEIVNPAGFEISGCTVTNYPASICSGSINPKVRVTNNGLDTVNNLNVGMILDNGAAVMQSVSVNLPFGYSTVVTFPLTNLTNGAHSIKFFTSNPNNSPDLAPANDTLTYNFTVGVPLTPPIVEGFESPTFPPAGWSLINSDAGLTWTRSTAAQKSGVASALINFYNYTSPGEIDYLVSPLVDVSGADSINVSFERAYKRFGTGSGLSDTLSIQVSVACGSTSFPILVWKKGGNDLATSTGTFSNNWTPGASDWLRETVDIKPFLPAGSNNVQIAFVSKNGYGQNLWLDDINISNAVLQQTDARANSISDPGSKVCSGDLTPTVQILNNGKLPLTSVKVVYRITGPAAFSLLDSVQWNGNLATAGVANVLLKPLSLPTPGIYNILAYTKSPNNGNDQVTANDTTRISFRYFATIPAPLFEGFESATFPPPNWALENQDGQETWFRTTSAKQSGLASAVIDNYNYNAAGTNDELESPLVSYNGIDSASLTFSLAHATYVYPGSTGIPLDTLEVLVTTDCGKTLHSVYKKWGEDLQTINNPNAPFTDLFIPTSASQWRKETIDLSAFTGTSGSIQVFFRSKGNFGNSIFIDDINLTTKTLPVKLKTSGYLLSPNPFSSSFSIQHYIRPSGLRNIQVYNMAGQMVFSERFNGNALSYINIDLSRYASGVYIVKMIYTDKVISKRMVKQ